MNSLFLVNKDSLLNANISKEDYDNIISFDLLSQCEHPMLLAGLGLNECHPNPNNHTHCELYEFGQKIRNIINEYRKINI